QETIRTGPFFAPRVQQKTLQLPNVLQSEAKNDAKVERIEFKLRQQCNETTPKREVRHSKGWINSKPNRDVSPTMSLRRTFAIIGGVPLGTRLGATGEGAGIVSWTISFVRRGC